ncbi:MAG TPA: hypothetical protein VFQ86_01995 [Arachidicoccus soli]|nr:hypothetical protein [Arachidicoccus soli]
MKIAFTLYMHAVQKQLLALIAFLFCIAIPGLAQVDTVIENASVRLPDVTVSNVNIQQLLDRIKNDTSFYKAFKTLHIVGYTSYNNINILNKDGSIKASYDSKVQQIRNGDCRSDKVLEQKSTGDFFDRKGDYNYTIGELFSNLFFVKGKECGENNIVAGQTFGTSGKSGIEKKKEQLKMLFFNPGKKIPGIPFIGNKLDLYDAEAKQKYNYSLETTTYNGISAYIFTITPKPGASGIVIDKMSTIFDVLTLDVLERSYSLSYKAGLYDFNVNMQVELKHINGLLVPTVMRYSGDWSIVFKKRERATFTATLVDFKK